MKTRRNRLTIAARWAWIGVRRSKHRLAGHFQQHSVWPLATATGIIGIILLLLMHLSMLNAAVARPQGDTGGEAVAAEPAALLKPVSDRDEQPEPEPFELEPFPEQPAFDTAPIDRPDPAPIDDPFDEDSALDEAATPIPHREEMPPWRRNPVDAPQWDVEIERQAPSASGGDLDDEAEFMVDSGLSPITVEGETLLEQLGVLPSPGLTALPVDDWNAFDVVRLHGGATQIPYRGLPDPPPASLADEIDPADFDALGSPSYRELALHILKEIPGSATAERSYEYEIVVRNDGVDTIEQFEVDEQLGEDVQVLSAVPDAHYDNDRLRWRLRDLRPGDERRLAVTVLPKTGGRFEQATLVTAAAAVGAETRVEGPRLEFDVEAPQRVEVGQWCPIRFRVTNVGATDVSGIVIEDDLSEKLVHEDGRELGYDVGTLAPGESKEAQLAVKADALGTATNIARVTVNDTTVDEVSTRVEIAEATRQTPPTPAPRVGGPAARPQYPLCPCCGRHHPQWGGFHGGPSGAPALY